MFLVFDILDLFFNRVLTLYVNIESIKGSEDEKQKTTRKSETMCLSEGNQMFHRSWSVTGN